MLTEADAAGDAEHLARIAWELYARLGEAEARSVRLRAAVGGLARRAGLASEHHALAWGQHPGLASPT